MSLLEIIVLAIVEGITEFLPVSSTGHMIIASAMMGIEQEPFVKTFTVAIQLGAILSVLVLYWKKFLQSVNFYVKLFVAFLPAAVFGLLLNDFIESLLENVLVVAISLVLGGIVLVFIDKVFKNAGGDEEQEVSMLKGFKIGFFQLLSMIPGVSRSAATIIGGMTQGLNRKTAAEFSFFLAVPTMFGATCLTLFKSYDTIQPDEIRALLIGNVIAFLVAMVAIKTFITFLTKNGFKVFGYYRIILGLILIGLYIAGVPLDVV